MQGQQIRAGCFLLGDWQHWHKSKERAGEDSQGKRIERVVATWLEAQICSSVRCDMGRGRFDKSPKIWDANILTSRLYLTPCSLSFGDWHPLGDGMVTPQPWSCPCVVFSGLKLHDTRSSWLLLVTGDQWRPLLRASEEPPLGFGTLKQTADYSPVCSYSRGRLESSLSACCVWVSHPGPQQPGQGGSCSVQACLWCPRLLCSVHACLGENAEKEVLVQVLAVTLEVSIKK